MMKTLARVLGLVALMVVALFVSSAVAGAATVTITDKSTVDFSQTRTAGHYEFTVDGLHLWTDDATSQAKVAGYLGTDLALAAVTSASLSWTGTIPEPGAQLVVTAGGKTGILVGESVYGAQWWMSDSYCVTFGCSDLEIDYQTTGSGSTHSATLAQWSAALGDAKVTAVGFSLGSGVKGDGVLKSLTVGETTYVFVKAVEVPTSTTAPATSSTAATSTSSAPATTAPSSSDVVAPPVTSTLSSVVPTVVAGRAGTEESLAYTGADIDPAGLIIGASLMVGAGTGLVAMVVLRRRRRN